MTISGMSERYGCVQVYMYISRSIARISSYIPEVACELTSVPYTRIHVCMYVGVYIGKDICMRL